ncbi:WD40/YVTN/BNR-like repeat-containing protein [Acanthopleuribacter pedis]|uniref:Glycosyl hydrolase n=1 Tax=Acanthopleuribacter pedis TaxID=442870 RepID=A0A8J7U6P8_9BACT|nr:hypothetical protein [Acanthopleuribacter pedis]MBO1322154.1 hypothetical protein [Acanthopleuribacter pedis]
MAGRHLLVGTRKGLLQFILRDGAWYFDWLAFEGIQVPYACFDARSQTIWASVDHGHWGQKLHRSKDFGKTWQEIEVPKYPEDARLKEDKPAALDLIWVIEPGGVDEPERLYLGTNPGGLFVSDDGGDTFTMNAPLWNDPSREPFWFGAGKDSPGICSILVNPKNAKHLTIAVSVGGVYASFDGGLSWEGRNRGISSEFLPDPNSEFGHDPHFMTHCPAQPEVLWQQNHVGIYRSTDAGKNWQDISEKEGPARFGWPICACETNPEVAWVVPAQSDMSRVAVGGALCVSRTEDGGKSWQHFRQGLPQTHCYDIVYRHAFDNDVEHLAFGSTTGNLFASGDGGECWSTLGNYFPPVYSVRFYQT